MTKRPQGRPRGEFKIKRTFQMPPRVWEIFDAYAASYKGPSDALEVLVSTRATRKKKQ